MHNIVDYVEGNGVMHSIFNYTLEAPHNSTSVRLHHRWINSTTPSTPNSPLLFRGADLYLSVPSGSHAQFAITPGTNGSFSPPIIDILTPKGATGVVRVAVVTNETSLAGLGAEGLFLTPSANGDETPGLGVALEGLAGGGSAVANQVKPPFFVL